jgi:hypothetical protein
MKTMFLAAATVAALSGSTSTTFSPEAKIPDPATQISSTAAQQANPTGIPSYLMRPDGLMTNGLLPTNGWQG